ncbi:toll-like receptor 7 [Bombus huntii]|uniref:toll-like receptor 7 n=1 Tax=Bombus huntii TaxID=85661 RepID=UPI0021AAF131|nr:toll-like receptor 7 [Bombus huntii]
MLFVQWRILLPVFFSSQVVLAIFAGTKEHMTAYKLCTKVCIPGTILNFNNTGLTRIGDVFANTSDIRELYLDDNKIAYISDKAFDLMEGLEVLSISGNIIFLEELSWLRYHATLRSLIINNNKWRSKYGDKDDISIPNTFGYFPALEVLSLRGDNISQFDVPLDKFTPRLKKLDLSENYIQSFKFLDNLPETMEMLLLEKNGCPCQVRKLPANIRVLFLNENGITELCGARCTHSHSLSLKELKWLNILNVSSNSINSIESDAFKDTIHVQMIDLSHNYIGSVAEHVFRGLSSLKELRMSHNLLQIVPNMGSLNSLRYLDLANNYIEEVTNLNYLKSIETLEWLDLSNNRIKVLPTMLIYHTKSFEWNLLLKNNSIVNIDDLFTDKCLEIQLILHLQNNPFSFFKFNTLMVHTKEPVLPSVESNTILTESLEEFAIDSEEN